LVKWYEQYSSRGLVVVDIFNGPNDRQAGVGIEDIKAHLEHERVTFPVLYDSDGATCDAYGVHGYPSGYLLGRDGHVIWEDWWHSESRAERKIAKALEASTD
jgi:hypothetical protein